MINNILNILLISLMSGYNNYFIYVTPTCNCTYKDFYNPNQLYDFKKNMYYRDCFKKYMGRINKNYKDLIRTGVFDSIISISCRCILIRDQTILVELPKAYEKLIKKRRKIRYEISRIAMKGVERKIGNNNIVLPSDLVPYICGFAVIGSKKYKYM